MLLYASTAKLLLHLTMHQAGLRCQMPVKLASSVFHLQIQSLKGNSSLPRW